MGPGDRVRHAQQGLATVIRWIDGGRRALVRLDARPAVPTVLSAVELVAEGPAPETATAIERAPAPIIGDRQSLEALRLGVVPPSGLAALTVGRQAELAALTALFAQGRGLQIWSGHYGAGKTHLLDLAGEQALAEGYGLGRVTFDPEATPPSHPLRIYGALAAGLCWPGRADGGLMPLLLTLGSSARHLDGDRRHRWLSAALYAVHHAPEPLAEAVVAFVEGRGGDGAELSASLRRAGYRGDRLLALPDYRTFGQIMAHLLSGVATWAADAGWRGLTLLFDEAEYLDRMVGPSQELAETVLRYLAVAALPDAELAFDPQTLYKGGQTVHREVGPRFIAAAPLVALFAFTPHPAIDRALRRVVVERHLHELRPVRPSLLPQLAARIDALVRAVYPSFHPDPADEALVARLLAEGFAAGRIASTRAAARMVVEFWDLYRIDPKRALQAVGAAG